ncbi:MAG: phosphate ABC transporter permease subunit PstC, partial [Bifidobacterium castoris]|nr:phosphate ABC transporter permease subunit PstC [Bifidobacterium castoris]
MTSASKPSSSSASPLTKPVSGEKADRVFRAVAYACGILILVVLAAVALFLLFRAWPLIGGDQ